MAWRAEVAALDSADLVFVDESSTHCRLTRRWARALRGERVVGRVPRNYDPRLSLVAALTPAGAGPAMTVPGAVDRAAFTRYLRNVRVPTLRPGQVVLLDNLSVHKGAAVRQAIKTAGCRPLFLPPYSPDVALIEEACAKIKGYLRRVGAHPGRLGGRDRRGAGAHHSGGCPWLVQPLWLSPLRPIFM